MYLSTFRKLIKSVPDHRFPDHGVVICDEGCAYFYSDTLLCKFFLPEIQGCAVFPGNKLHALELRPPYRCSCDPGAKTSIINQYQLYNIPFPSTNYVNGHWQHLASDAIEITFDMSPQQWRSLLVSLHPKHPIYQNFYLNFRNRRIETIADARASYISDAIVEVKNYSEDVTSTQRAKLSIDWRTNEETTIMQDVLINGVLIPPDFMHAMMLDQFQGTLRYDYHNELLEYHSYKHFPSLFDQQPRHFHIQGRTQYKVFPDVAKLAPWDRSEYDYFILLCQKCLRSLRDQIRPYIDKKIRESVSFIPLPERGMQFQVTPRGSIQPMDFSLPNEQHNFPSTMCQQPVIKFDPFYLFDLLAFDGDMIVRIKDYQSPIMVEVEGINLKHVMMPIK